MTILTNNVLTIDNSALELITTCPRKAYFSLIRRRRIEAEQPALRFGGHIHSALAYRYKREAMLKPWSEEKQLTILERRFVATPCIDEGWRNLGMAQKVIQHYNEQHLLEPFDVLRGGSNNLPLVERPFALYMGKIGETSIVYTGRIDTIIKDIEGVFVMDHKTTSVMGPTYWQTTNMSEQQRGYCYACKESLGFEPTGYITNVLATRAPTRTGTSIEFARQRFYTKVPPGQLDEWRDNMLAQVDVFLYYHKKNVYPAHHYHCVHKFGVCEFYSVCEMPKDAREAVLMSPAFKENTWSPLYHN